MNALNPLQPGWHAQLFHRDHITTQLAAEAERRAQEAKPTPARKPRTRKPRTP